MKRDKNWTCRIQETNKQKEDELRTEEAIKKIEVLKTSTIH